MIGLYEGGVGMGIWFMAHALLFFCFCCGLVFFLGWDNALFLCIFLGSGSTWL